MGGMIKALEPTEHLDVLGTLGVRILIIINTSSTSGDMGNLRQELRTSSL